MVRVGLAYGSGALVNANLENNTGYGSGYRMGYFDDDLDFVELARTDEDETQIHHGQDPERVGERLPPTPPRTTAGRPSAATTCWWGAATAPMRRLRRRRRLCGTASWPGSDGDYQVRAGSYTIESAAQSAASSYGGAVAGTSSYGVNVTRTGSAEILFQFDGGG